MCIGSYVGVKENVPAYLDPNLGINDLISGVSFASAGSGYDPLTPTITVSSNLHLPSLRLALDTVKRQTIVNNIRLGHL